MIAIIIAGVVGGIVLVALIMVLNLTVASGTINGVVFYASVISSSFSVELALPKFVMAYGLIWSLDLTFVSFTEWMHVGRHGFNWFFLHTSSYW